MTPRHHLDDSTLLSYAAGALLPPLEVVAACHIASCERCAERVIEAEMLGGALLRSGHRVAPADTDTHVTTTRLTAADLLSRVESESEEDAAASVAVADDQPCNERTPATLRRWLGDDYDALNWSGMTPGIHQVKIDVGEGNLRMFRIAPGACMPMHSHHGSELTMVLRGSYSDEIGRFGPGDVADLDPDIEHQPIADRDQDCICVIATDAPLRFRGILPRLFQPFVGL